MAKKSNRNLIFRNRDTGAVKTYTGAENVSVSGSDLGTGWEGRGPVVKTDTNDAHEMTVSLDAAAAAKGKKVRTSTVGELVGLLGGSDTTTLSQSFTLEVAANTTILHTTHALVNPAAGRDSWSVNWGDGQTETYTDGRRYLMPHTYERAGTYTIRLTNAQIIWFDAGCFYANLGLIALEIPEGVTVVGDKCFGDCKNLKRLTVASTVTSMGEFCLMGCDGVQIDLRGSTGRNANSVSNDVMGKNAVVTVHHADDSLLRNVTSENMTVVITTDVTELGDFCFAGCTGMTFQGSAENQLKIPTSISRIGVGCFMECEGFKEVEIPNSVQFIGCDCFSRCRGLHITLRGTTGLQEEPTYGPDETPDPSKFYYANPGDLFGTDARVDIYQPVDFLCYGVTSENLSVTICGFSNNSIGKKCFYGCRNLTKAELNTSGWFYIGDSAFERCTSLPWLNLVLALPLRIGEGAFRNCRALTAVPLKDGVQTISDSAFAYCTNLTDVTIPSTVTKVGDDCFKGCANLNVVLKGQTGRTSSSPDSDVFGRACTLTLSRADAYMLYRVTSDDLTVKFETDSTVKTIGDFFCSGATVTKDTETVVIPHGLKAVTLPTMLETIGNNAFSYCEHLSEVNLTAQLRTLGSSCFLGCTILNDVVLPSNLSVVGASCFKDCLGFTVIRFPQNVYSLGSSALQGCRNLRRVIFDREGKTSYEKYSYPSLFMDGVPTKEENPSCVLFVARDLVNFYLDDANWKKWTIRPLTTTLTVTIAANDDGVDIFGGMAAKVNPFTEWFINWGDTGDGDWESSHTMDETYMPPHAYPASDVEKTYTITLKNAELQTIEDDGFKDNSYLVGIRLPDSVVSLGACGFFGCTELTTVQLEESSVRSIGEECFANCPKLAQSASSAFVIPASVKSLGESCFHGCEGIHIDLKGETGRTSSSAFNDLFGAGATVTVHHAVPNLMRRVVSSELRVILDDEDVTEIGDFCFADCPLDTDKDDGKLVIPESVARIGRSCFSGNENLCVALRGLTGRTAASGADDLFGTNATIWLEPSDGLVPDYFLSRVTSDKLTVVVGLGVTSLGTRCLADCTGLVSCEFLNDPTHAAELSLGESCLRGCTALKAIDILNRVTSFGDFCLADIPDLKADLWGCLTGRNSISEPNAMFGANATVTIHMADVPDYYLTGITSPGLKIVLDESAVQTLGTRAFFGCIGLKEIKIPTSVTSLSDECLAGVSGLLVKMYGQTGRTAYSTETDLFGSKATVEIHTTGDATNYLLTKVVSPGLSVELTGDVKAFGLSACDGCTGIASVSFGSNLTTLGNLAFRGCPGLRFVDLPKKVTTLGTYCFSETGLTSFKGGAYTAVPVGLFKGCASLTDVTLASGVKSIGESAFESCTSLYTVAIPPSLTTLGKNAFLGCTRLYEMEIPPTVTRLAAGFFSGCRRLHTLTMTHGTKYAYLTDFLKDVPDDDQPNPCTIYVPSGILADYEGDPKWEPWFFLPMEEGFKVTVKAGTTVFAALPKKLTATQKKKAAAAAVLTADAAPSNEIEEDAKGTGTTTVQTFTDWWRVDWGDGDASILVSDQKSMPKHTYKTAGTFTIKPVGALMTAFGKDCFKGVTGLEKIEIPESVTTLGENCFSGCSSLNEVTLTEYLPTLPKKCFENCTALKSFTVPEGVTSIQDDCFKDVNNLKIKMYGGGRSSTAGADANMFGSGTEVTVYRSAATRANLLRNVTSPNLSVAFDAAVTAIAENLFYGCTGLNGKTVTIPAKVTSMGNGCFEGTTGVTFDFYGRTGRTGNSTANAFLGSSPVVNVYPNAATDSSGVVSDYLLYRLTSSELAVTVKPDVKGIGAATFADCSGLKSLTLPNGLLTLGNSACANAVQLTAVTLPETVTSIGESAFKGCTKLGALTVPASVTAIGANACSGCSGMTALTIRGIATTIGNNAFLNCSALKTATLNTAAAFAVGSSDAKSVFLSCKGSLTTVTIGSTVPELANSCFEGCTALNALTIPSSVTKLGSQVCKNCTGLNGKSITIPSSVTNMGANGFTGCSGIVFTVNGRLGWTAKGANDMFGSNATVTFGAVPDYAAYAVTSSNLTVKFATSVTTIGAFAFAECTGLSSVTLRSGLTSAGQQAFENCTSLGSVSVPSSLVSLGTYCFRFCSGLTSMSVASGNTSYDSRNSCNAIVKKSDNCLLFGCRNSTIPATVASLGSYCFARCGMSGAVSVPSNVSAILDHAYSECGGITSISLTASTTSYGDYCFEKTGISALPTLTGTSVISAGMFYGCTSLVTVHVPTHITTLGNRCFGACTGIQELYLDRSSSTYTYDDTLYGGPSFLWLVVPSGFLSWYKAANGWSRYLTEADQTISFTASGSLSPTLSSVTVEMIDKWSGWRVDYGNGVRRIYGRDRTTLESTSFTGSATIKIWGARVKTLGNSTFSGCSRLTSISLPNTVTSFGDSCFSGCSSLGSITLPSTGFSLGNQCFNGCSSLRGSFILGTYGITHIGNQCFNGCSNLSFSDQGTGYQGCTFGGKTNVFGSNATLTITGWWDAHDGFSGTNFKTVTIERSAWVPFSFNSCNGTTFYLHGMPYNQNQTGGNVLGSNATVYVYDSYYKLAGITSSMSVHVQNEMTEIPAGFCESCTGLKSISFTSGSRIASIGASAFKNCSSLSSFSIPSSCQSIGESAFTGTGIRSLSIPYNCSVGAQHFNPNSFSSLYLPAARAYSSSSLHDYNADTFFDYDSMAKPTSRYGVTIYFKKGYNYTDDPFNPGRPFFEGGFSMPFLYKWDSWCQMYVITGSGSAWKLKPY